MKRVVAILMMCCMLLTTASASSLQSDLYFFLKNACEDLSESGMLQDSLYVIDDVNEQVIIFLQIDKIADLITGGNSAALNTIDALSEKLYTMFRYVVDMKAEKYSVYVVITDNAVLEDDETRTIFWIHGTHPTSVHSTLWSVQVSDELPEQFQFLTTLTSK